MIKDAIKKMDTRTLVWLSAFLGTVVIAEIVLTAVIPLWREHFYDVLEKKDQGAFFTSMVLFMGMMLGLGAAQGLKVWAGQLISFEIRKASTKLLFKPWVKGARAAKNYTQAMTEALRNATELYLSISIEVLISAIIVAALVFVNLDNPPLLWIATAYSLLMTATAVVFNKPLVGSDMEWQEEEGQFRETLSYLRTGENCFTFKEKLERVAVAYYRYVRILMYFTLFSRIKSSLSQLVPYILLSYPYFAGTITLGEFMKGVGSFELITINATIILVLYPRLTQARASYNISKKFYDEVREES